MFHIDDRYFHNISKVKIHTPKVYGDIFLASDVSVSPDIFGPVGKASVNVSLTTLNRIISPKIYT